MSTSTASVTPGNIQLTPVRVKFNGVDLGGTVDGVKINQKFDMADIKVDQGGSTVWDQVVSGMSWRVKFTLAETKNKDNWKVAFPSVHEIVNGSVKSIYADMQVGDHLLSHAAVLLLHPLENADSNLNDDYKFYKAACIQASEVTYGPDKQTGLAVEFIVFPDTSVSPARFMILGDPSNGIVNAAAGSPAYGGGNTGNGTVGSVTVSNDNTATETITGTCQNGGVGGNNFYIAGSVSGPLGLVHVAASAASTGTLNSGPINLIITQGSTQFVAGDTFTIATTASNYA